MSSTTDTPTSERGQILVIFAFSLFVIFGIAALAFDGGLILLEKRDQQNAADAAAIAGARFLPVDQVLAEAEAREVATENGFTDGVGDVAVTVTFPSAGRIAVDIDNTRLSFFAGIWGIFDHDVGSRAVAVNEDRPVGPFGLLALEPEDCDALMISGQGVLETNGNVQVNSTCTTGAMRLGGQGEVVAGPDVQCNVVGDFGSGGGSDYDCELHEAPEGISPIPDPFLGLNPYEPPIPVDGSGAIVYPTPPLQEGGPTKDIPTGCPGSATPGTDTAPAVCQFPGSYDGTTWRLYPGYYPGGIHIQSGTFLLEPGIYQTRGGGFQVNGGSAALTSVATGGTTLGGGVLIFNGHDDSDLALDGQIFLNGGDADISLWPLESGTWAGMSVYQDADICLEVVLNGASSGMIVRGVIYAPCGHVKVNGNTGTVITDQIVANTFALIGNGGGLTIAFDEDFLPQLRLAGLIE